MAKVLAKLTKPRLKLTRRLQLVLAVGVGVLAGLAVLAVLIEAAYADKIFPGVAVANTPVGGLRRDQAAPALLSVRDSFQTSQIAISASGTEILVSPDDLKLSLDLSASLEEAFKIGHGPSFLGNWGERLAALFGGRNLPAQISFDEEKLHQEIVALAAKVGTEPQDATVKIDHGLVSVVKSRSGLVLDVRAIEAAVKSKVSLLEPAQLTFNLVSVQPAVTEDDTSLAKTEADAAISSPVSLTWKDRSWTLSPTQITSIITFTTEKSLAANLTLTVGEESLQIGEIRTLAAGEKLSERPKLHLAVDPTKLNSALSEVTPAINQSAVDAKFQFSGGKLLSFAADREGREVDLISLSLILSTKLLSGENRTAAIPVKVTAPKATLAELNNLGLKELLGRGVSKYAGSSAARVQNIRVAAARINGTLVPPGEVFSMSQTVGDISISEGYAVGLIISGGRTQPGVGGGVCQVSTTLFRSALNSGLPIIERYPHAYRVGYYEQNSPPGVDASVYFPTSDFKFKNDTGHYILIQAINDQAAATLTFEIYGTSDGRQVSISTPIVSNQIPAPAALYQDDPTLAKGVTKQVDYSAPGATTVFNRTVVRDGQTIYNDSFYTKYQPWRAIFLVGTKEG